MPIATAGRQAIAGKSISSLSITRPITQAGAGGGGDALLDAAIALSPVFLYDHKDITSFFSDSAMTTQAVVGGPIGAVRDKSGNNWHRRQTNNAKRPTLRQSGSLYYIEYNGTSHFLATDAIDLTGTNVLTLCWGAAKETGNNNALVLESSSNGATTNGTMRLSANGGSIENWEFAIRGTTAQGQFRKSLSGSSKNVVTMIGELIVAAALVDQLTVRVDGVAATVAGAGTTGGSNYGNHAWYFGARGGTANFFSGDDYGGALYAIKAAGADIAAIEAFTADRAGVTL